MCILLYDTSQPVPATFQGLDIHVCLAAAYWLAQLESCVADKAFIPLIDLPCVCSISPFLSLFLHPLSFQEIFFLFGKSLICFEQQK